MSPRYTLFVCRERRPGFEEPDQLEATEGPGRMSDIESVDCFHSWRVDDFFGSAVTVTSTRAPFLSLTSSPCSSVSVFSIRRSRYRWSAPSTAIFAFSGWPGPRDGMILSTVPGRLVLGCSGIRAVSRFSSAILADLAMRGLAISFLTLARVAVGVFRSFLTQHAPMMTSRWKPCSRISDSCANFRHRQNRSKVECSLSPAETNAFLGAT